MSGFPLIEFGRERTPFDLESESVSLHYNHTTLKGLRVGASVASTLALVWLHYAWWYSAAVRPLYASHLLAAALLSNTVGVVTGLLISRYGNRSKLMGGGALLYLLSSVAFFVAGQVHLEGPAWMWSLIENQGVISFFFFLFLPGFVSLGWLVVVCWSVLLAPMGARRS